MSIPLPPTAGECERRLYDRSRPLRHGRQPCRIVLWGCMISPSIISSMFLAGNAAEIGFNRYTILNLHAILANNLVADERAGGRLRHIVVGIDGSVYHPPETPQFVEECFDQLLATAAAITDPFEQSFL